MALKQRFCCSDCNEKYKLAERRQALQRFREEGHQVEKPKTLCLAEVEEAIASGQLKPRTNEQLLEAAQAELRRRRQ
jgi:hypothetical protein